jgi:hypothetical protein
MSRLNLSAPESHQHSWEVIEELEQFCALSDLPQIAITCWCGLTRVIERKDRRPVDFGDLDVHQLDALLSALCTIGRADYIGSAGQRGTRTRPILINIARAALREAGVNWAIAGTRLKDEPAPPLRKTAEQEETH